LTLDARRPASLVGPVLERALRLFAKVRLIEEAIGVNSRVERCDDHAKAVGTLPGKLEFAVAGA
jgi:hypothetical protein